MKLVLARTAPRRRKESPADALVAEFVERASRLQPCEVRDFGAEAGVLEFLDKNSRRTRPVLVVADPRGEALTSEAFAARLGSWIDGGVQEIVLAIGPADGWSAAALGRADLKLSFGRMTLPHELAAVVLAEQLYRALTILAGHPYHSGH